MHDQQPLLFIVTPNYDELEEHTDQESTSVFELEKLEISNRLIANQLRFFARSQPKWTSIRFHLTNGETLIGSIISLTGASVCIEANGAQILFNGNEIEKIERFK